MDDLGNRTGSQDLRSGSESYSVDDVTNRYESIDSNDLTYDAAGNLTTDKDGYQYSYDYENRLILVKDSSNAYVAEYKYDALGRRVFTVVYRPAPLMPIITINYHNAQWQVLAEYEYDPIAQEENFARRFVYGNYIDEPLLMTDANDDDYYYVQDHLYNVTALLDETGAVLERYEYDAYGKMTHLDPDFTAFSGTDHNNPYYFTGRRLDVLDNGNLKLQYSRWRYYHLDMARFLTPDPLGYVDGMSLYQYVGSTPIARMDPFGLIEWGDVSFIFGSKAPESEYNERIQIGKSLYNHPKAKPPWSWRIPDYHNPGMYRVIYEDDIIKMNAYNTADAGGLFGRPLSKEFLLHYLSNKGTPKDVDYPNFIKVDKKARSDYEAIREAAMVSALVEDYEDVVSKGLVTRNDYEAQQPVAPDYISAVQDHQLWAKVTNFSKQDDGNYIMNFEVHLRDYYDWDAADDKKVGFVSPAELWKLHNWGIAQNFLSCGLRKQTIIFDCDGNILNEFDWFFSNSCWEYDPLFKK